MGVRLIIYITILLNRLFTFQPPALWGTPAKEGNGDRMKGKGRKKCNSPLSDGVVADWDVKIN